MMTEQMNTFISNIFSDLKIPDYRSSRPEEFLGKVALKICSKFTGEHPCLSDISIKSLAAVLNSHFGIDVLL